MPGYIPISGLNKFTVVSEDDFVALVDSASLTTYRVPAQAFLNLVAISGSVISSSYASASKSSVSSSWASSSISASWANRTLTAITASISNTASLAFGVNGPHTGSTWGTASWALSSSVASRSFVADSCSIAVSASFTPAVISSSFSSRTISASYANNTTSASYAFFSTSASFAKNSATASFVDPTLSVGVKAYGAVSFWSDNSCVGANSWTSPTINASYNIASVTYDSSYRVNPATSTTLKPKSGQQYKITFTTPMPSAAYVVTVTSGAEENTEDITWTVHPFTKTANYFWITRVGGNANNDAPYAESNWFEFAVIQ